MLLVAPAHPVAAWRLVLACLAALVVDHRRCVYAYLPLRSAMDPPLDYAHPADWSDAGRVTAASATSSSASSSRAPSTPMPSLPEAASARSGQVLQANLGVAALARARWACSLGICAPAPADAS